MEMSSRKGISRNSDEENEMRAFVDCIFQQWFGLQAAIAHGMGGSPLETNKKISQMIDQVTMMCFIENTTIDDLSDALEESADAYFDTIFDDGSVEAVALDLWKRSRDWLAGNKESIRSYIAEKSKSAHQFTCERLQENSDEEEMEIDVDTNASHNVTGITSPCEPTKVECDDGWTVPRYSRRKNR